MVRTADFYKILQVQYGARKSEIASSYKRLCKIYHPDLNSHPEAEEMMKRINMAYDALCNERPAPRAGFPFAGTGEQSGCSSIDLVQAQACIRSYFSALLIGDYVKAYDYVSDYDKKYVTLRSFCEWRKAVQKLYAMRDFSIKPDGQISTIVLENNPGLLSVKYYVSVTERNTVMQTVSNYSVSKLVISESGIWHIFLGYRDLNEIAKIFEDLSSKQESGEMTKHWEEYCKNTCRDLNMFSLSGLLKEAKRELYRCRRYKQQMTVACFRVRPEPPTATEDLIAELAEAASGILSDVLRETDIPAYLGNGVFAVLFVELRKKNAKIITDRITDRIKNDILEKSGQKICASAGFTVYNGGNLSDYIDKCVKSI
ncbi:MAG: DnaJ domain-containing protein [Oscillospiraceae bacterium]|nr:DnaJ domain-containing protein [Oscillospiraceae bacterium]